MRSRHFLVPFVATGLLHAQQSARLPLRAKDHVAIVGSAIADRMQHTAFFEAMLYAAFPDHDLTVRTLAVAGDEVGTWHRSDGFGSRDEWLARVRADVVIAFHGFNESFAGDQGLPAFRTKLGAFVDGLRGRTFGDAGPTRVVLCTPIACERHLDAGFPDPARNNERLQAYANAIADVAREKGAACVDLFTPSRQLFAAAAAAGRSLTVNGLHLDDDGDRELAAPLFRALFDAEPPAVSPTLLAAVRDKNRCWHQRYRTIDAYNIHGGRSYEKYAPRDRSGVTGEPILNRTVMQREMEIRDAMTTKRDVRVWAIARGGDAPVTDDGLPPEIPVATNHPGDRDDLSWTYPDGEAVIPKLQVATGCRVNLFACEKRFPELVNPVQMMQDARGRMWVAVWPNYPERRPLSTKGDSLLVFEDTDRDGRADRCTTFADDLNAPTGFTFFRDGVLLMQAPDLLFLRDTDGDGRADVRQRVLMGIDSADSHHTANAMGLDPALATTLSDGYFHRTQIETWNGPLRHADGCVWRFEPRTGRVELYAPYELVNAHGKAWDEWGNDLLTNATSNLTFFGPAISGHLDAGKHPEMKQFWDRPSRPCPGTAIVSSAHFPADWQGDFLNCNVIGLQAITRVHVTQDGAGLKGETVENVVAADPAVLPTFRPVCLSHGPDGALYFCDWAQTIIGHLQHHIRDPNRDHEHGRVYRITYEGRSLATPPRIVGASIDDLVKLLADDVQDTRTLAKLELGTREVPKVVAAARAWVGSLDPKAPRVEHHVLEALWLCQSLDVVAVDLLDRVLHSTDPRARAAATKVLCDWRDRVPDVLDRLLVAANDDDPRVRLHAVRAASFFRGGDVERAAQIAFAGLGKPVDYYIDYVFGETMRQLRTQTDTVLMPTDERLAANYAARMPDRDLARAPATVTVLRERLDRASSTPAQRQAALDELVAKHGERAVTELVDSLARQDSRRDDGDVACSDIARMLVPIVPGDLVLYQLGVLAAGAHRPAVRRAALAATVAATGDAAKVFANSDEAGRCLTLETLSLLAAPELRETFAPVVQKVLGDRAAPAPLRRAAFAAVPALPADDDVVAGHFTTLAAALAAGEERATVAQALLQLPRSSWNATAAGTAATSVLTWAQGVPADDRTNEDFLVVTQCADELASLLPDAERARVRKELRAVTVPVFVLHTVREKMRYDRTQLVVEMKKPFEIVLINDDFMAHNLAVVKPGTRAAVGAASASMSPSQLDGKGRAYMPKTDDILAAMRLVEPGRREKLAVPAIATPGEYEFVCTVPGHVNLMWGTLVVTDDVGKWLETHAAPAAAPAEPAGHEHVHEHR